MLKKEDYSQLELFSQGNDPTRKKGASRSFLSRLWNYEKTILIIIAFLITAIVSFSFGVEKGKSLAVRRTNARIDVANSRMTGPAAISQQPLGSNRQPLVLPRQRQQPLSLTQNLPESPGGYTIQLASFATKSLAQKEAELLRKKGYAPLVMSKGKYTVLYIGNFSNKETASKVLAEFKKRYSDCYIIRRL